MPALTSADGTKIAYETIGSGPALILVDGAMCFRGAGPMTPLAALMQESFTVYTYDRRGRGESTDTLPYAPIREIEDLQGLVTEAGGEAYVYAISSGTALALHTAAVTPGITKLALYDPPFLAETEDGTRTKAYTERLTALLAEDRKGDAVALFMTHVGIPEQVIAGMRTQPGWPRMEAIALTLAYDDTLLADSTVPRAITSKITAPALLLAGTASPEGLQQAAKATAEALPNATYRPLSDQTHDVAPQALAPILTTFFTP